MKALKRLPLRATLKLAVMAALLLGISCSTDRMQNTEAHLNSTNAKSKKGKKNQNATLKVLAQGAVLKGANGIDIGADGHLYIASVNGQEIVVMNRNNGKIVNRIGQDQLVLGPDDIVIGPDGSIYWTDILVGEVGRLTPSGEVTKQFVALGVNPITFSDDGRLFVALDFLGDGLYELDPNLTDPPRHIIASTMENPFPLGFFNSFDFGPDGRLYGPLFAAGLVISVDVGMPGDPISTNPFIDGTAQVVAGGFTNPAAAKFGPDGLLFVLDQTGELFKIDITTGAKTLFSELQPGLDNMTFDTDGSLYMTNNDHGWVAEILPSGQARIISPGGMIAPQGLAVLPGKKNKDIVYEADLFNLRAFSGTSGQQENIYKGFLVPEGAESLTLPMNLSASGDKLIISSWFSGVVQVWDPEHGVETTIDTGIGEEAGVPINAIGFKGDLIIADLLRGGLIWGSDLSPIDLGGLPLFVASGLTTDGETVWVTDWATGNVLAIGFDGTTPNSHAIVASGLSFPEGMAFEKEDSLVVVETGLAQLSRIDLSTGTVSKIIDGLNLSGPALPDFPPTWYFDGVAVGTSGDIYVSGAGATVIYKIRGNKVR